MGVIQTAAAIPVDSSPETTDSLIAYRNSAQGKQYNSITLDGGKNYTLLFAECDQKFTPTEWGTAIVAIDQAMSAQGKTFDVQALFEITGSTLSEPPSGTSVFWEYWGDTAEFRKHKDALKAGAYYCILICESDEALTEDDVDLAVSTISSAVPARTIAMAMRQRAVYTDALEVKFTAHHQYETSQRDLARALSSGTTDIQKDMYVEVPIAKLDEDMAGPLATTIDSEGVEQMQSWREGCNFIESLDGAMALLVLSPSRGGCWDARLFTPDIVSAYVTEFGAENILSFEAYKTLRNSEAYTNPEPQVG